MEWMLRLYLLAGLATHKVMWEILKRREISAPSTATPSVQVRVVKLAKKVFLAALIAQVVLPIAWVPVPALMTPRSFFVTSAGFLLFTAGLALALAGRVQLGNNWADIESAT